QAGSVHVDVQPAGRLQGFAGSRSSSPEGCGSDSPGTCAVSEREEDCGATLWRGNRATVRGNSQIKRSMSRAQQPAKPASMLRSYLFTGGGTRVGKHRGLC